MPSLDNVALIPESIWLSAEASSTGGDKVLAVPK